MSHNPQTLIERLRLLKQSSERNNEIIANLKKSPTTYLNSTPINIEQFKNPLYIEQYHQPDLYSQMMADFETRNKHIIDSKLYYERSNELLSDVLSMVDTYDESQLDYHISQLKIQNIESINQLINTLPSKSTLLDKANKQKKDGNAQKEDGNKQEKAGKAQIKTIELTEPLPETTKKKRTRLKVQNEAKAEANAEAEPVIDDLTPEEQEKVVEYIDIEYNRLIKVMKVYFILADGKYYRLPPVNKILEIKEKLEGYLHVPDIDVSNGRIRNGTYIYYLTINELSNVDLMSGYVLKTSATGIILVDEENNKKKHIDFKCPIFRKINNLDIALFIKKLSPSTDSA